MRRREFSWGIVASLAGAPGVAGAQPKQKVTDLGFGLRLAISSPSDIPRRNGAVRFASYALFVATRPELTTTEQVLSQEFNAFGDAIGDRNLAVFVTSRTSGNFDIPTGRTLVDLVNQKYGLRLSYDDGPFVLLLPSHPMDAKAAGEQAAVVEFRRQNQAMIAANLRRLKNIILARAPDERRPGMFKLLWTRVASEFTPEGPARLRMSA